MSKQNQRGSKLVSVLIIIAVLLAISFGGYYYYNKSRGNLTNDQEIAKLEKEIGKLIVLPTDEKPILATINDVAALSAQQPFFIGSQNGDKLLVYQKARKAFIYSETLGKLVNVGPIVYNQSASRSIDSQTQTTKTKVASSTEPSTKKK